MHKIATKIQYVNTYSKLEARNNGRNFVKNTKIWYNKKMENKNTQTEDLPKPEGEGDKLAKPDIALLTQENEKKYNEAKARLERMSQKLKDIHIDNNATDECSKKAVTLYEQVQCKLDEITNMLVALEKAYVPGKKVELTAIEICKRGKYKPKHCWDWIQHVYHRAGVKRNLLYVDLGYSGLDCGKHHASPAMVNQITSGDLIFYNNKNTADEHGNHSVIFLGWIDREKGIAQVASGFKDNPGRIHEANLKEKPVTYIARPAIPLKQQETVAQNMAIGTQKIFHELNGIEEVVSQIVDQQQLASLEKKIT